MQQGFSHALQLSVHHKLTTTNMQFRFQQVYSQVLGGGGALT